MNGKGASGGAASVGVAAAKTELAAPNDWVRAAESDSGKAAAAVARNAEGAPPPPPNAEDDDGAAVLLLKADGGAVLVALNAEEVVWLSTFANGVAVAVAGVVLLLLLEALPPIDPNTDVVGCALVEDANTERCDKSAGAAAAEAASVAGRETPPNADEKLIKFFF